jgi:hypothetical protein
MVYITTAVPKAVPEENTPVVGLMVPKVVGETLQVPPVAVSTKVPVLRVHMDAGPTKAAGDALVVQVVVAGLPQPLL